MGTNRRQFLIRSTGVGAAALLAGASAITWDQLRDRARRDPLPEGAGILVLVSLYGGNDGINTVIPFADNAYYDARPELAYRPEDVLRLDDSLGLNPSLKGLHRLWRSQNLAIVRGAGYPKPDRSHFRSMDIWQTASPERPVSTGWIGRWLDTGAPDPVRAVNIGPTLPPLAVGTKATAAALRTTKEARLADSLSAIPELLAVPDSRDTACAALVRDCYRAQRTAMNIFDPVVNVSPAGNAAQRGLGAQLDLVARCIKAGVPTRVYCVSLGGFDTHANERGTQEQLLGGFDTAVTKFLANIASDQYGKNVVLMAYSEFGRRVKANASDGTDHGTAGPVFIAGTPVRGGYYGDQPSLTNLDRGDLKATSDFRDIYAELLHRVLGGDSGQILGPGRREMGFLA